MPNTLTTPYQGRTYQATLATGRKVVITVLQGYGPDGGEVARLHEAALTRYGETVAGCLIPTLNQPSRDIGREPRWWAVELKQEFTRVDYLPFGEVDCYADVETSYELLSSACPGLIPFLIEKLCPGWDISDFCPSSAIDETAEE